MGCTSAKPRPPEVAQPEGELPMKKRSQALFSRGESQFDEMEGDERQGTPAQSSAIGAAAAQPAAALQTVAEVEVGSDGVLKAEPPKPERPRTPPKTPPKPPSPAAAAPPSPINMAPSPVPASPAAAASLGAAAAAAAAVVVVETEAKVEVSKEAPMEEASESDADERGAQGEEESGDGEEEREEPTEEKTEVPATEKAEVPAPDATSLQAEPAAPPMATAFAVAAGTENTSTVEDRLNRVEQVLYPSAKAALSSKGLKQYIPEMEARGIIEYRDLANVVEDLSDPFWNRMPPIPDRKKFRSLVEEARAAYGLPPSDPQQSPPSSPPAPVRTEEEDASKEVQAPSIHVLPTLVTGHEEVPAEGEVDAPPPPTPPREKQATPCDDYQTDIFATEFGMCTCGHPKKMHNLSGGPALAKTPSYAQRQASKSNLQAAETPKDGSVCNNYSVDLKATTFGTCVCGHPKAAHSAGQNSAQINRFKELPKGSFNKNSPMPPRKGSSDGGAAQTPSKPPLPAGPDPSKVAAAAEPVAAPPVEVEETQEPSASKASEEEVEAPKVLQSTTTEDNLL